MINLIANRYAEALFQIGEEENITSSLYEELIDIVELFKSSNDLYNVLKSPFISKSEKKSLIDTIFTEQISDNLRNLLKILVDKDRITSLKDIKTSYKQLLNEKDNIVEGIAISAIPLNESEIKELGIKLSDKYRKNVVLENKVDESILGGVLVKLGNEEIDGTVKTRLAKMKEQLSQLIS